MTAVIHNPELLVLDEPFSGLDPVKVFNQFADMKENLLNIKDLVKQALHHSIYRMKPNGKIYEGEFEVAMDELERVKQIVKQH